MTKLIDLLDGVTYAKDKHYLYKYIPDHSPYGYLINHIELSTREAGNSRLSDPDWKVVSPFTILSQAEYE